MLQLWLTQQVLLESCGAERVSWGWNLDARRRTSSFSASQIVTTEKERESVFPSHLIRERGHRQRKVHLVHPLSTPHAGFPGALSKSLRPQACPEHDSQGLLVTH